MRLPIITLLLLLFPFGGGGLTASGAPRGLRIEEQSRTKYTATARSILERFLESCPAKIVLVDAPDPSLVGDGYIIDASAKGRVTIQGSRKGLVYGACSFLERYLDMDYWGEGDYYKGPAAGTLPTGRIVDNPSMTYRQTSNYMMRSDSLYTWWYRLENPSEEFVASYWVHTCNRLLPASKYGKSHPEYYAYFDGARHPGSASQWCMTNPEVLEVVCSRLDSLFKAYPDLHTISVSQNDGSDTYCRCPQCKAILDAEGSPSGPVIYFVNKVAERFPDKTISTLAYLFTVQPPKNLRPRSNVQIMLCDIDCRRQTSLRENPSGQYFMKALEGWAAVSSNIFVWDYGINFDNYLSPFPNLSTIWDNMQIFKEFGVKMHFSQINSSRGGDFAELRTYLVAKLMWNPDIPLETLLRRFLDRYYGPAGAPIYTYIKLMEGASVGTDVDLFIYDSPVSYKDNILRPTLVTRYNRLFDEAEEKVAGDPVLLDRVRRTRLPLQYSALEIARTSADLDRGAVARDLDLFEQRTAYFKVPTLNERHNAPADYCKLYRSRYLGDVRDNLAYGKSVTYGIPPERKYLPLKDRSLTDAVYGGTTYVENWVGWKGTDGEFTIDLGQVQPLRSASVDFLRQLGAWILMPEKVAYYLSDDGKEFREAASIDIPEDRGASVEFIPVEAKFPQGTAARYLKVYVTGGKICPPWHYGVGNPSWFFIDEVVVR